MSVPDKFDRARAGENLANGLAVLRRRWLLVAVIVVSCVSVLVASHERKPKTYAATASVSFQNSTLAGSALQVASTGSGEPQREANTEVLIAHSEEVAEAVRRQLGLQGSAGELLGEVNVQAAPNADILNIVSTTGEPKTSARLANAFAEQFIAFRAQSQLASIDSAQTKLQHQIAALPTGSPERTTLEGSLQRLAELRAVAGGGANIIGRAAPPGSPTGTSLTTTVVIGLLIGLALAFTVVFLLESLDRRVKSVDEFEREYRLTPLAGVPLSAFRAPLAKERAKLLEPYRILRSALDFAAVTRQLDTLLVTSAVPSEGKTTVAVDLAHAEALTGRRVVLLELDLRRPTFAAHFNLGIDRGLTAALTGEASVSELLVEPFPDLPNFSVLPVGRVPYNPSELLGSPRIAEIISELASDVDIVVIDSAPLNPVADTQVLLNNPAVHAAIVVARVDLTTRDEARDARAILDRHMVEPVGIVITGLRDAGRYGHYGYGLGPEPTPTPQPDAHMSVLASEAPVSVRRHLRT
jgi:non-specific protein-tyrosine kinase